MRFTSARARLGCAAALVSLLATTAIRSQDAPAPDRTVILVPVAAQVSWQDDAFLAAVAAAAQVNGEPLVLAVAPADPWRPELLDFLRRYEATSLWWVGEPAAAPPAGIPLRSVPCDSAASAASALAELGWPAARQAVLFDPADRAAALSAAVLAARLRVPLFPCGADGLEEAVRGCLERLGVTRALAVGAGNARRIDGLRLLRLSGPEEVVRWMARNRLPVDYLAAVNPDDDAVSPARRLSLAAVVLAAGRGGALAPLASGSLWKRAFPTTGEVEQAPDGAHASRATPRHGRFEWAGESFAFLTGAEPADGRWWAQIDRDGDGAFGGPGEGPVYTGGTLELGGRTWVVDLDVEESRRGQSLWLTSPTPAELRADLARHRAAAGREPRFLCLVGWPESLPLAIVSHGQGIDTDLVSDLPYGQTDDDPFVELAFARFVAEDLAAATLIACRGLAYDDFRERAWQDRFATAEWEGVCRETLEGAGFEFAGHHDGAAPIDAASPLTGAGLIVHASHAMWTVLGGTYAWDSPTLLAPCLVESAGCSTASLDQDAEFRSVAARLLRNGAVGFVGNSRRGIAQQDLFRSEIWNAVLAGQTLGEANRSALNRLTVAALEKGQAGGGPYYYQLYNHAVYGDPALAIGLPAAAPEAAARLVQRGGVATIHAPERWSRFEYAPLAEWGCAFPKLYSWRGPGMTTEDWWFDPEKRNEEALYYTAELRTRRRIDTVEPLDQPPTPLGWTGRCFVDQHADGSRSLYWRVRLIDFDMTSGEVLAEVDQLRFRLGAE